MSNFNIYQFVVTAYLIIDRFKQWSVASGQQYGIIIYNKMIWCQLWHRHSSFVIHLAWWWWWYYACYTKYMTWFIFNWRNCLCICQCVGAWRMNSHFYLTSFNCFKLSAILFCIRHCTMISSFVPDINDKLQCY